MFFIVLDLWWHQRVLWVVQPFLHGSLSDPLIFSLINSYWDKTLINFLKIYKWTVSYSKFSRYESLVSRRLREQLVAMAGLVVVSERAAHWPELTRPQIYCTKRPDSTRCATRVPCLSTTTTTVMHQLHLNFTNKEYKATKYFVFQIKSKTMKSAKKETVKLKTGFS